MSSPSELDSSSDSRPARILVYGYGNPGRQDDGVGVAFVDALEAWARSGERPWLTFDSNYQLNAEDALAAAEHDVVIFVDASQDQPEGFRFRPLSPSGAVSFSTHAMSPESVIALARELYGARPAAYLLTIKGKEWEPNAPMTAEAKIRLEAAKAFLTPFLECPGGELPIHR